MNDAEVRLTAWVHGRVQKVGFRWWTRSQALALGITGAATNLVDGRVCVTAEGSREAVAELLARLAETPSRFARPGAVDTVITRWSQPRGVQGFASR